MIHTKLKNLILTHLVGTIFYLLCSCASTNINSNTQNTVNPTNQIQPTDSADSIGDTQLGTIVGNPNGKSGTTLTLKTITSLSDENESSGGCQETVFEKNYPDKTAKTQKCIATPQEYSFGLVNIYLLECLNDTGKSVTCTADNKFSIHKRVMVYESSPVEITADNIGAKIDLDMTTLSGTNNFGGLQIVTTYIGQRFPSEDSMDANVVKKELQGKSFRICSIPDNLEIDPIYAESCGNQQARRGNMLLDYDDNKTFGFIDTATLTPDYLQETIFRPADYTSFNVPKIQNSSLAFAGNPILEYTNGTDFGTIEGLFAPILGFESVTQIQSGMSYSVSATIDITDSMFFIDGARNGIPESACVSTITNGNCIEDNDPGSVGIYNPYYDGVINPLPPKTSVTVTPL